MVYIYYKELYNVYIVESSKQNARRTTMTFTVKNLTNPIFDTVVEGTLRNALYVKTGMKSLHISDSITIEDEDGYIVPSKLQAKWMKNIVTS